MYFMQLCKYKLFVLSPIPYYLWQTICIICDAADS